MSMKNKWFNAKKSNKKKSITIETNINLLKKEQTQ